MSQPHPKLVRDRIPELIRQAGKDCATRILSESDYRQALRNKLLEEAQEAAIATNTLIEELADLYEVIDAILAAYAIEREAVLQAQIRKRSERGGFEKRIELMGVYDSSNSNENR